MSRCRTFRQWRSMQSELVHLNRNLTAMNIAYIHMFSYLGFNDPSSKLRRSLWGETVNMAP